MRVEKKAKILPIESLDTSHNSVHNQSLNCSGSSGSKNGLVVDWSRYTTTTIIMNAICNIII